jgi:hypothetical protein
LCFVLIVSSTPPQAAQINWKSVAIEDMEVIFRGEALGLKFEKAKRAWVNSISTTVEYSVWRHGWKRATIIKWQADPGRTFRIKGRLDDKNSIKSAFAYTKTRQINWQEKLPFRSALGTLNINFMRVGEVNCISWAFGFDDNSAGEAWSDSVNNLVRALYCQKEQVEIAFAKRIVLLSGYKGGYIPPKSENFAANGSDTAATPRAENSNDDGNWISVPIAASWQGVNDLFAGILKYRNDRGKGPLTFATHDLSCKGTWQFVSGKYGTDNPPIGTWAIACNRGLAASGTYISRKAGTGGGEGIDAAGRAVKITFGKN